MTSRVRGIIFHSENPIKSSDRFQTFFGNIFPFGFIIMPSAR